MSARRPGRPVRAGTAARGRTLIELVIAMALSLLMLAVLGGIYLSARQGTRSVDQNAQLQDAGRFALAAVGRELRQAGWSPILNPADPNLALRRLANTGVTPIDACRAGYSSPTATGTPACNASAGTAADAPDAFTVRYISDAGNVETTLDCTGAPQALVVNRFFIAANSSAGGARSELRCAGANGVVTFLDNVEAMRLQVGVDTSVPVDGVVDTWLRPDQVTAAQFRSSVVAVRVCLLVVSPESGITTGAATYTDCDGQVIATNAAGGNGRMRRAFTTTVGLRNNLTVF
jgi:type IV pilus assembly protein PilW